MSARAFVLGWPVAHSRSPLIHRFWLHRHNIAGDYVREAVPPEGVEAFLRSFKDRGKERGKERGYVGGNVTIPHKQAAFCACSVLTPVARSLGAVNTLWLEDGRLAGDNTDPYGFAANLDECAPGWREGSTALLIGAGGASRAILHALLEAGFGRVFILNRTSARAEELAAHFAGAVRAGGLDALARLLPQADLIVHATSAGMAGSAGLDIDWSAARADALAADIVYVPLVTPFLAGAAGRGLCTVGGLGMLLHQAAPGFERWFGVRPGVDAQLRALVAADIGR